MMLQNNLFNQFMKFAREFMASGKDAQSEINNMLASGKITKEQLEEATTKAKKLCGKK